jgi:hypothetical protein
MCIPCQLKKQNDDAKFERLLPKFKTEAKNQGLERFAVVRTVNPNPGFMWREIESEDCQRLELVGVYIT